MSVHPAAAAGFARTADDYERSRPTYPAAAVDDLVTRLGLTSGRTVVDVAAGTGKLTRLLVASGADIVAVEPVAEMRRLLQEAVPSADVRDGLAEDLPLPDGSADAITVAQAFHWFDQVAAEASFHRVLRPGGAVAIVYNKRQPVDWMAEINAVIEPFRAGAPRHRSGFDTTARFGPPEAAMFDNPMTMSPERVVGVFKSISFVGALDAVRQHEVLAHIAAVIATHPATRGRSEIVMPYRTVVSVCPRR